MAINKLVKLLGQCCILCLIVAGPWRNGGSEPTVLRFFLYLIVASGVLALATLWTTPKYEREKFSFFSTLLVSTPVILGLGLCCLQLVPLSEATLGKLSPHTIELKKTLLPKNLDVSLTQLSTFETDEALRESLRCSDEITLNKDFLAQTIPWDSSSSFDLERAIILDQAVENEFLNSDQESKTVFWGKSISVYPLLTRQSILLFWGALILLFSASVLFNTPAARSFLFKTVVFTGVLFALLCVLMSADPKGVRDGFLRDYWDTYLIFGQYGTYVNKNASAGYLILTFAACMFLTVREFLQSAFWINKERENRAREERSFRREQIYDVKTDPRWKVILGDFFDLFNRRLSFWLVITAFLFSAIFMSMSRGASVSASIAFILGCALLMGKKEVRPYWYAIVSTIILSLTVVFVSSRYDKVDARMSTLIEEDKAGETAVHSDSRWENWQVALESSKDYVWFGSGLGTYSLANRPNDAALKNGQLFYYAENVFIQTLLEMGWIGLSLLISEYLLLFLMLGRFLNGRRSNEAFSLSIGATMLVTGQVLAACADFGNYLPANLFLFVILCGCVLGRQNNKLQEKLTSDLINKQTASKTVRKIEISKQRKKVGLILTSFVLVFALLGSKWVFDENADWIMRWRLHAESKLTAEEYLHMSSGALDSLVDEYESYIAVRDDSYEVRADLMRIKMLQYQLYVLNALKEANPSLDETRLWQGTSSDLLLDTLLKYQAIGFEVPVRAIRERPEVREYLAYATQNSLVARRICPLYVNINRSVISTIPLTAGLSWEDGQLLAELYARRIASFVPYSSHELLKSGYYLAFFKLHGLQKQFLRISLDHTTSVTDLVLNIVGASVPPSKLEETFDEVFPDDINKLLLIYQRAEKWSKDSPVDSAVKAKVVKTLAGVPEEQQDATYYYFSAVYNESIGEYELADECLLKALNLEPYNPDYCLRRVRLLIKHRAILEKDEECLCFIQEVLPELRGRARQECENYLETAKKNIRDAEARRRAHERIRSEREMDERIKQKTTSAVEEEQLRSEDTLDSTNEGFERSFEEELKSFNIDDLL